MKISSLLLACGALLSLGVGAGELESGWDAPPLAARTRAYWWWLNGNVNKAAITRDLEWMQFIGMGGGLIFDAGGATQGGHVPVPAGPLFGSAEWRELFKHTLKEADRLGLEVSLNIQSGWNLGGPVVKPEDSAKRIAFSEQRLVGPQKFSATLPQPKARDNFYRDTFVLAFRIKDGAGLPKPQISVSSAQVEGNTAAMLDGSLDTFWVSHGNATGQGPSAKNPEWVALAFAQPVTLGGVRVVGRPGYGPRDCEWQVADDGKKFKTVQAFTAENKKTAELHFAPVTAADFRLLVRSSYDPREQQHPRNVQIAEIVPLDAQGAPLLTGRGRAPIQNVQQKAAFHELGGSATDCAPLLEDVPATPGEEDVAAADVLDLTEKFSDGKLNWDVPAGQWQVLRFGYTLNGARVSTASGEWQGMVLDYLDADALRGYWQQVVAPILADAGPLAGKTLKNLQTDSWELGGVNWTKTFSAEFAKRRGYAIQPWLPVLAGRIVTSRAESNKFLNDFRRTIADLVHDNQYALMATNAQKFGMGIQPESGGPHCACLDGLQNFGLNSMPMSEFWVPSPHRPTDEARFFVKQASSAAHIYGKPIACAEGFTSIGPQWNDLLWCSQKPSFDHEACAGLNLVFWHAFTCSPPEMGLPGQEYFAGTHFNPQITWAKQAHAFISYLDRSQFLLQRGKFVGDVCFYYGDHVPNFVRLKKDDPAKVLPEFDYDVCNEEVLLTRMSAQDGRIVLPDGMSYRVLALPNVKTMSLAAARKIRELVLAGATVIGPKPERTTGRQDDAELKKIADELWDSGRIKLQTAKAALAALGVKADVELNIEHRTSNIEHPRMDWIHRRDGEAEIYFISNQEAEAQNVAAIFRVSGKQPELWDAVTGARRAAAAFTQADGRTTVPLELPPYGAQFVIFQKPATTNGTGNNFPALTKVGELTGAWQVTFDAKWGAPAAVEFEKLVSWTERPEPGIKSYSGTATYRKTFDLPPEVRGQRSEIRGQKSEVGGQKDISGSDLYLSLGNIGFIADVRLNGKKLGVIWAAPFQIEISGAVQPTGNVLEIDVVNGWWNRVLADEALPADQRLTKTNIRIGASHKRDKPQPQPAGLLGPVTLLQEK